MAAQSSAAAGHGEWHGASLERAGEGRGRERERVEQAGEFGSVYSCTWGEVVSMHERGEPREPRGVETLCAVGLCCCFC